MSKFLRIFLLAILTFIPLFGVCQIAVPKWVDDIGGPSSNCISSDVAVDKQNNIYVTGFFSGTADFDPSTGSYPLTTHGGQFDTFVAKYTTDGKLIWAVNFGGDQTTQVNSITVDKDGNPTVSGQFNNSSMTVGNTVLTSGGDYNAFVVKLNTSGNFLWAKSIGGGGTDYGQKVIADSQDNVIETLRYSETVQVGGKTFSSAAGGGFNAMAVKYDSNGNVLWVINIPDNSDSEALSGDIDAQDNFLMGGYFTGTDNFNPLGTTKNYSGGGIFIAKYTSAGQLVWFNNFTGVDNIGLGVCFDSQSNVFAYGHFNNQLQFGSFTLSRTGPQDIYVAKYTSAGAFQRAIDVGGSNSTISNYGIHASHDGNILIGGYFSGTIDFDPSPATTAVVTYHGNQDMFLAKYDDNLNYKWAFSAGSPDCNQTLGRNVAVDYNNDVIYTGGFCSTVNFSASSCSAFNVTAQSVGSRDCFLAKYTQNTGTANGEITGFTVPQQSSPTVIDQTNLKITVTVPAGTNITALVPTVTYSSGYTLSPASGQAEDFTSGATYTITGNCQTLNYTVNIVFTASATQITACSGTTVPLAGGAAKPTPDSYLWQTLQNSTWVNAPGTNNTANYTTAALTNTGTINVVFDFRRQITTGGVATYDSYYDITIAPGITTNTITAPADSIFCTSGDPANITGSTPTGGAGAGSYTYQWASSTNGTTFTNINAATAINYDPPVISTTTYYQRTVTSNSCPEASNTIRIIIEAPPAPPANIVAQTCQGSTAVLSVTAQAGITYNWYDSPSKTNLLFTGDSFTTPPLTQTTTYYVESNNGICSSTALATATVNIILPPAAPQVSSTGTTCSGSQVTVNIISPQTGYTYNWYTDATGGTPVFTGTTFTTPALSQTTAYYAEAVNSNGCTSTRTQENIVVSQAPDISVQSSSTCPNTSAALVAQSLDANTTINWYSTASGGTILYTGTTFNTPVLSINTTYYAEAVDKTTQCISTQRAVATVTILTQLATPIVTVQSTLPTQVTFQWAAVAGAAGYKVSTDNGVTFTDPTSGTDGLYTTISGLSEGQSVTIIVEAIGTYSCENSAISGAVTAIAQYPQNSIIYVPNAFTPNGDGKNDVVHVHGSGIQSMVFHIYDQYGELIFSSTNINDGWNGTYKGTLQPVGVYVYYVEAQLYNGQTVNKKGTITLLK